MTSFTDYPPSKASHTKPSSEWHEDWYSVNEIEMVSSKTSGVWAPNAAGAGTSGWSGIQDTGITCMLLSTSGDYCTWKVPIPHNQDVTQNMGFQLVFTTSASATVLTASASGYTKIDMTYLPVNFIEQDEISGGTYLAADVDWVDTNYSGKTAYSGVSPALISTVAWVSGYLNGAAASGTNLDKNTIIRVKATKTSALTGCVPMQIMGLRVFRKLESL